ncbi:MAG: hypothetical protein VB031_08250 [Eubacteriaceae bacterium]|nr:hypothetical protein [Eubacteriaceae bacterium]
MKWSLYLYTERQGARVLQTAEDQKGEEYQNLTKGLIITGRMQVLSGDITCIRAESGFEYLATVLSLT